MSPGLIYVVGGIGGEGIELCSVEVYDPISKRWSTLPEMGTRRAYLGVATLNDCIYAVGGCNEAQDALPTVEKYSFEEVRFSFHKPNYKPYSFLLTLSRICLINCTKKTAITSTSLSSEFFQRLCTFLINWVL